MRGWALPLILVLAAAGLFVAGLAVEKPRSGDPRLAVVSGRAAVDGRPARAEQPVRPGSVLITGREGGAITLRGPAGDLTLAARTELVRRGRAWGGAESWRLAAGEVVAKPGASSAGLLVESDLGSVRARETAFELEVSPILTGAAVDTPRVLQLAVASGSAELLPAGRRGAAIRVSAGVAARLVEGCPDKAAARPLLAAEWQKLLGEPPSFADPKLPAADVPRGVWVPRWPGRNGPTPGSAGKAFMSYSPEHRGGVFAPAGGDECWCYDALADRWRAMPKGILGLPPPLPNAMPPMPGCEGAAARAWSPRATAGLAWADGRTWTWRPGYPGWRQLEPPNNPPPRSRAALYYDPGADLFVLFGGTGPGGTCSDVWVLRL